MNSTPKALQIIDSGRVDESDSAFPSLVQLPDQTILCAYSVGGGQYVTGGTDVSRSLDGGRTWNKLTTILEYTTNPSQANFLKLSLAHDKRTIYAYGTRFLSDEETAFGQRPGETVLCRSTDGGQTWTKPDVVPMPADCPFEVSYSAVALQSGRLLAPCAPLPARDRLAERVLVMISDDGGKTWPTSSVVFEDTANRSAFFEHKFSEFAPNCILATAWTASLGDYVDRPNSFAISRDGGATWGPVRSTGISGQTMSTLPLGGDRLLVLYNRRYGDQGVVAALVTMTDDAWTIHHDALMYDARARRERPADVEKFQDELDTFAFGFPTSIRLADGDVLATHWCVERGICGIRWTRLRING